MSVVSEPLRSLSGLAVGWVEWLRVVSGGDADKVEPLRAIEGVESGESGVSGLSVF